MQRATRKRDMPVQDEAGRKADAKGDKYGSDIGGNGHKAQVNIVLMQDIVEAEPVHPDIQQRTRTPAGRISKGLQRHDPAKGRIKEINKGDDAFFQLLCHHINFPG